MQIGGNIYNKTFGIVKLHKKCIFYEEIHEKLGDDQNQFINNI